MLGGSRGVIGHGLPTILRLEVHPEHLGIVYSFKKKKSIFTKKSLSIPYPGSKIVHFFLIRIAMNIAIRILLSRN